MHHKGKIATHLLVLSALCTLSKPSTALIAFTTGLSEVTVRRAIKLLREEYDVKVDFVRSRGKAADASGGFYELKNTGIFSSDRLVKFFMERGNEK